jgi:glycosyltransferase involved in cell wall biosynthesis
VKIKVIHVVENLDHRFAVEKWLVRMLGHARRQGAAFDWTFYCSVGRSGRLEEMARTLGAHIVHSPIPIGRLSSFVPALRAELKRGQYDVLHCHHDLVSAVYLVASRGLSIRRRIVHIHNADEEVLTSHPWKRRFYRLALRQACYALADRIVGISNHTLDTFLAGRSRRPGRDIVHYYGVDPTPFEGPPPDRAGFRKQYGLPDGALILLFGGRIVPEKNPVFAVDVLSALRRTEPRAVGVFAGTGALEDAVVARAKALGIESAVCMLGWRSDLPMIMRSADWFILPRPEHPMEGFGLAVVEAQLAGLRILVSRGVPDDALLPSASLRRLPLSAPPVDWAAAAVELLDASPPSPSAARQALGVSPMNMDQALENLVKLYT